MAEKLTAAELGKLWAVYMGNGMSQCVLSYFLRHVDDPDIRQALEEALRLCESFVDFARSAMEGEGAVLPIGFSAEDVNLDAPRLFADEFYLHYLKYAAKAGISIYGIAVPLMTRGDVKQFFSDAVVSTVHLITRTTDLLYTKGNGVKPPHIPIPKQPRTVAKHHYFNGFWGRIRPLQALEIAHLYDNVENNVTSGTVLSGFAQVARTPEVKAFMQRGEHIAEKHLEIFSGLLEKESLPTNPTLVHTVTPSTTAPFSEKLMLYHKIDMFAMRIRSYANSMAVSARHDLAAVYARLMVEVGQYAEDGATLLINAGWMEGPPEAADRAALG